MTCECPYLRQQKRRHKNWEKNMRMLGNSIFVYLCPMDGPIGGEGTWLISVLNSPDPGGTFFLGTVDASSKVQDASMLTHHLPESWTWYTYVCPTQHPDGHTTAVFCLCCWTDLLYRTRAMGPNVASPCFAASIPFFTSSVGSSGLETSPRDKPLQARYLC